MAVDPYSGYPYPPCVFLLNCAPHTLQTKTKLERTLPTDKKLRRAHPRTSEENTETSLIRAVMIFCGFLVSRRRFLKTSAKLKHLDISGCRHVTNKGLQRLTAENLQSLHIAHCSLVNQNGFQETLNKVQYTPFCLFYC